MEFNTVVFNKRTAIIEWLIFVGALLGSAYFIIASFIWGIFGLCMPMFVWDEKQIDWSMLLQAIPCLVILLLFIKALIYSC